VIHCAVHQTLLRGLLATAALVIAGAVAAQTSDAPLDADGSPLTSAIAPVFYENDFIASLDYGLICAIKFVGAVETGTPHMFTGAPSFAARTTTIPAQIGLSFGVRVRATGPAKLRDVTISLRHPATGANRTTLDSWPATITAKNPATTSSFSFETTDELALGRWIFEAHKDGQLLYHVEFNVVDPDRAQHLVRICVDNSQSR